MPWYKMKMIDAEMNEPLRSMPRVILWTALAFGALVFLDSFWRWWTFQYQTFDLAFYVQGLWLALRGKWMVSLLNVPVLGNHAEPIVFLAAPLFAICPHPMLLVALQTLAIASLPFTAWRIGALLALDRRSAMLLALATLLAPATGFVALHEFHPEAFAAPFLLLLIEARMARRLGRFWLWFVAVLACKENLALMLVGFCAVHLFLDWRQKAERRWLLHWNLLPLVVALLWVGLYAKVLGPALNGGNVDYLDLYSQLGKSGPAILNNFFQHPGLALGVFGHALSNGNLVWALVLPFLGLPLLRPRWLLIAAPIVLQHLLSYRSSEWTINFHYAAPLLPLCWIAAAEALAKFRARGALLANLLLVGCGIGQIWCGPVWSIGRDVVSAGAMWWSRDWKAQVLAEIPADASVTAGLPYLSHLAQRERLVSLHHLLKGLKTLSRKEFQPEAPTDVVVMDAADRATFDSRAGFYHPAMRAEDGRIIASSDLLLHTHMQPCTWRLRSVNSLSVYSQIAAAPAVAEAVAAPASGTLIDPYSNIVGLEVRPITGGNALALRVDWAFRYPRKTFPWMQLIMTNGTERFIVAKGLVGINSTAEAFTERWIVAVPPSLPPGRYRLSLAFWDNCVVSWANAAPGREPPPAGVEIQIGGCVLPL